MATTDRQARNYIREVTEAARVAREKHSIDESDITLSIRVDIQSQVTYHNHEDED